MRSNLVQGALLSSFYTTLSGIQLPVVMSVVGFEDMGGQNAPADTVTITVTGTLEGGGTLPNIEVQASVKVEASFVIC